MTATLLVVLAGYFGAVLALGWFGYLRTRTAADFMVAGRSLGALVGGATLAATQISAGTFVGTVGLHYMAGVCFAWVWPGAWLGWLRLSPEAAAVADVIAGVVFFVALMVPAAFFAERLLFAAPDIRRQLLLFGAILLGIWIILSQVHPAFQIAHPVIILLALGLPGGNTTAMLIAAFLIHGMQPGPMLYASRPDIIYGIFVAMLMSNVFLLVLTIMSIQLFLQLNRLPYTAFSAAIMIGAPCASSAPTKCT